MRRDRRRTVRHGGEAAAEGGRERREDGPSRGGSPEWLFHLEDERRVALVIVVTEEPHDRFVRGRAGRVSASEERKSPDQGRQGRERVTGREDPEGDHGRHDDPNVRHDEPGTAVAESRRLTLVEE